MSSSESDSARIDSLNAEAKFASTATSYADALRLADEAYDLARAAGYTSGMAQAAETRGRVHHFRAEYEQARAFGQEALTLYEEIGDLEGQARALNVLGMLHREIGDLPAALDFHQRQISLFQQLGDQHGEGNGYAGIAAILHYQGETRRALDYGEKALAIFRQIGHSGNTARMLNNMIEMHHALGDHQRALEVGRRTEAFFTDSANPMPPRSTTEFYSRMALIHTARGDLDTAAAYALRGVTLAEAHGLNRQRAHLLHQLGRIAWDRGRSSVALGHLHAAVAVGESMGFAGWLHDTYALLSEAYQSMGDYAGALAWHQRFHKALLAVHNEEKELHLRQLELRFQVENARKETDFYRQEAARIEAQREQERVSFERLSRLKTDLLATTTHDIKNPLASIKLAADMLRQTAEVEQPQIGRFISSIERQVARISALISNLLELAKLETGHTLDLQPVVLSHLLAGVLAHSTFQASARSIEIAIVQPAQPVYVICEQPRIERVLDNLISNAIKYTTEGGRVDITVTVPQFADAPPHARIAIRDTGMGIPEDALPFIFEPFYRVQSASHRAVEGTGLGLAIVKTIVEQHGGTISVESALGVGSTFTFTLPLG